MIHCGAHKLEVNNPPDPIHFGVAAQGFLVVCLQMYETRKWRSCNRKANIFQVRNDVTKYILFVIIYMKHEIILNHIVILYVS